MVEFGCRMAVAALLPALPAASRKPGVPGGIM
jgi:hypothetical protein